MKRVLHVFHVMDRGGAETLVMNVFRNIDRSQVTFDFAVQTTRVGHYDDEILDLGGQIIHLTHPAEMGIRAYKRALIRALHRFGDYDTIHSHVYQFSGYILKLAKELGVPQRVAHSHNTTDGRHGTGVRKMYRAYMRALLKENATHLFGCSREACHSLYGHNCWNDPRVQVIPNAIDLSAYKRTNSSTDVLRDELNLSKDSVLIGHVGRFVQQKNHEYLLRVYERILRHRDDVHLILVGDGPLRSEIERKCLDYGLESRVHFMGVRSDIPDVLRSLDLFLLPSIYEGFPVVSMEAQAAGVPCIFSDAVTSEVDMQHGLVNYLPLNHDGAMWSERCLELIQNRSHSVADPVETIRQRGYDIRDLACKLQKLYLGQVTGNETTTLWSTVPDI